MAQKKTAKAKKTVQQKAQEGKQLTASQRIEALEASFTAQAQNIQAVAQEIDALRQTMTAIARRLNATIQAGEQGSVNNEAVKNLLVEENIRELEDKVKFLVENKVLEEDTKEEVHKRSFLIGRELDEDKKVINPRMQFAVSSLTDEAQKKVLGKKVGDLISDFSGDGIDLEISKVFAIAEQKNQNKNYEEEDKKSE